MKSSGLSFYWFSPLLFFFFFFWLFSVSLSLLSLSVCLYFLASVCGFLLLDDTYSCFLLCLFKAPYMHTCHVCNANCVTSWFGHKRKDTFFFPADISPWSDVLPIAQGSKLECLINFILAKQFGPMHLRQCIYKRKWLQRCPKNSCADYLRGIAFTALLLSSIYCQKKKNS